jgi:8-amino-7-oxononanoate synthase
MHSSRSLANMTSVEKREAAKRVLQARAAGSEASASGPGVRPRGRRPSGAPQGGVESSSFETLPEAIRIRQSLEQMQQARIANPYFRSRQSLSEGTVAIDGRAYINFSGYNYLGLSGHPEVLTAAKAAIDCFGTSASASRILSGEIPLHGELERALAEALGVDDAIVFNSGYSTNVTTLGHLFGAKDLIVHDSLIHNSALVGCQLSGAYRLPFPHNDLDRLDRLLGQHRSGYERTLILIEGAYSMDGDIPDLPQLIEIKRKHNAMIMVDEAHSMGILGPRGFGIGDHFDVDRNAVDLWMGTLSKTFASCGGYIASSKATVDYLKYTAPGFVYSVGISPPDAAAALSALQILAREPERVAALRERARLFLDLAGQRGLNTGPSDGSAIVPVIVGDSMISLRLADRLFALGINVHPIMYPAVEEHAARLRFFINFLHTEEQIRCTVDSVATALQQIRQ